MPSMSETTRMIFGELAELVFSLNGKIEATGSQMIAGATDESDWDYFILIPGGYAALVRGLTELGFNHGGSFYESSYKKGLINAICLHTEREWEHWHVATYGARVLGLTSREERIIFFEGVRSNFGNVLNELIHSRLAREVDEDSVSQSEGEETTTVGARPPAEPVTNSTPGRRAFHEHGGGRGGRAPITEGTGGISSLNRMQERSTDSVVAVDRPMPW